MFASQGVYGATYWLSLCCCIGPPASLCSGEAVVFNVGVLWFCSNESSAHEQLAVLWFYSREGSSTAVAHKQNFSRQADIPYRNRITSIKLMALSLRGATGFISKSLPCPLQLPGIHLCLWEKASDHWKLASTTEEASPLYSSLNILKPRLLIQLKVLHCEERLLVLSSLMSCIIAFKKMGIKR